jgi:AraC family transcriptional regulator
MGVSNLHIDLVMTLIEAVESNLFSNTTVDDICKHSDFSKWQTQRIFRALTGDSIASYIRGRKLTQALLFLESSSVAKTAEAFGYGSAEAFTRAFIKNFEFSPSQYQKNRYLASQIKPRLSRDKIAQIAKNISKDPVLKTLDAKTFVGLSKKIPAPFSENSIFNKNLLMFWKDFLEKSSSIPNAISGCSYGITKYAKGPSSDNFFNYYAMTETTGLQTDLPAPLSVLQIPQQKYAIFEIKGPIQNCHIVTDYIFGIWMPEKNQLVDDGFIIDVYDHRIFSWHGDSSIFYRMVPYNG